MTGGFRAVNIRSPAAGVGRSRNRMTPNEQSQLSFGTGSNRVVSDRSNPHFHKFLRAHGCSTGRQLARSTFGQAFRQAGHQVSDGFLPRDDLHNRAQCRGRTSGRSMSAGDHRLPPGAAASRMFVPEGAFRIAYFFGGAPSALLICGRNSCEPIARSLTPNRS